MAGIEDCACATFIIETWPYLNCSSKSLTDSAQTELLGLLVERGESEAAIDAGRSLMALARRLDDRDRMVRTACHMASALCRLGL